MDTTVKTGRRVRFHVPPRLEKAINILSIVAILVLLSMVALWKIPSNYLIYVPATATSVNPHLYVAGHPAGPGRGQFLFTFVEEPQSNLLEQLFAHFNPDASLEPKPPSFDASAYQQQNVQLMLSSEQTAELVALCHLGYKLCYGGVAIQQIEPFSKNKDVLKVGDIIVDVDGKPVATFDQLKAALVKRPVGAAIRLTIKRSGKTLNVEATTTKSPTATHVPVLGVSVTQVLANQFPSKLPIDMKIDAGDIGGPSAGLMFTLGLLQRLSPTDLTKGYQIAGTGTISLDGSVGAIGGVKQKIIGAQWAHANYFFVPVDGGNYADAKKVVGKSMTLVPVHSLNDALKFLNGLKPKQ